MSNIYKPHYKIFVDYLRELRLQANMTQQDLASALGCHQSYVSKYECGQKRLDIVEIWNICAVLGVSLSEFADEYESRLRKGGLLE